MQKKILYVGNFSFPNGNASGARVLGNGYLFRELGYKTFFIGLDKQLNENSNLPETRNEFEGFAYYNLPYPKGVRGWIAYKQRYIEVAKLIKDLNIDIIILYGSPTISLFGSLLKSFAKKNNIKILTDVVDWLAIGSGGLIFRIVKYFDTNYQKRYLNNQVDGVITISSYLQKYYKKRVDNTIIIPPLVNTLHFNQLYNNISTHKTTKIIYVGEPFPINATNVNPKSFKDRLDKVIDTLYKLKEHDFIFDVYGLTYDQYITVVDYQKDKLNELKDKVIFHGPIENRIARQKIAQSDYSILFRDINKMTKAGFPTKVVESISCGTPVITNNTSDLQNYIFEGENGFVVDLSKPDLHLHKMNEILKMDTMAINKMKQNCAKSELFSYQNFKDKTERFLQKI